MRDLTTDAAHLRTLEGMEVSIRSICEASCGESLPCEAPCFSVTEILRRGGPCLRIIMGVPADPPNHGARSRRLRILREQRNTIQSLRNELRDLAVLMRRRDAAEFDENEKPVTSAEWFAAIRRAEEKSHAS